MLRLQELRKAYGETVALDGLSFSVEPGTIFGFVGANGAGKTTAMRIVLGVLSANAGEVRFDGRPVDEAARRRFGYMPEERGLYPKMTVGRQLTYFARLHGVSEPEAARSAGELVEELGLRLGRLLEREHTEAAVRVAAIVEAGDRLLARVAALREADGALGQAGLGGKDAVVDLLPPGGRASADAEQLELVLRDRRLELRVEHH